MRKVQQLCTIAGTYQDQRAGFQLQVLFFIQQAWGPYPRLNGPLCMTPYAQTKLQALMYQLIEITW